MEARGHEDLTPLVAAARHGDETARNRLFELFYGELCRMARTSRRGPRHANRMQAAALANETFLQFARRFPNLISGRRIGMEQFRFVVRMTMRTIRRDRWRRRTASKRGGPARTLSLDERDLPDERSDRARRLGFRELYEAMNELRRHDGLCFEVVMHRYFAGRSVEETARILGVDAARVRSSRRLALDWLHTRLSASGQGDLP